MKVKVKAKVVITGGVSGMSHADMDYEPIIYDGKMWRLFGTPYKVAKGDIKPYKSRKAAKRGAETTAKSLGITLVWEVAK